MKNQTAEVFTFQYHNSTNHEIRTIQKDNGSIWFISVDVCKALKLNSTAIRRLDDDEKGLHKTHTLGGKQGLTIISESGLYSLIMRSNKPEAKKFRKWVTSEVLPQIRKTGAYIQEPTRRDVISPLAVASFLQATMDTFWNIEKALVEYEAVKDNLKKARRDTSIVIRSIRKAFPLASENCNLLGDFDKIPLEIEMR